MAKWEYIRLTWTEVVNPDPKQAVSRSYQYVMNGEPVREWSAFKVTDFLNALGNEGWEMVGCGNIALDNHCIYFKRPKS